MVKYLLILLLTVSCASNYIPKNNEYFNNYKEIFRSYSKEYGHKIERNPNISISFDKIKNPDILGYCQRFGNGDKYIVIDEVFWQVLDSDEREILLLHELGHCILGQEHRTFTLPDGCELSIMNKSLTSGWCYKEYKEEYLNELFGY